MNQEELNQKLTYLRHQAEMFKLEFATAIKESRLRWSVARGIEKSRAYIRNPFAPTGDFDEDSDPNS